MGVVLKMFAKKIFISSILFMLVYVLISAVFALIYFSLEKSFYHANPKFDPVYYELKESLVNDLCLSFGGVYSFTDGDGDCFIKIEKSQNFNIFSRLEGFDQATVHAISLRVGDVTDSKIKINIHPHIQQFKSTAKGYGSTGGSGDVYEINLDESNEYGKSIRLSFISPGSLFQLIPPVPQKNYKSYVEYIFHEKIIEIKNVNVIRINSGHFLSLQATQGSLFKLKDYLTSAPRREPSYLKLLYFSSLSLASFGFGEIIPIGHVARLFVAFEVIFGLILFGLFISHLFDEYKSHRERAIVRERNSQRLASLFKLWPKYYVDFIEARTRVTKPFHEGKLTIEEIRFSDLENLFFEFNLNTIQAIKKIAYKSYFGSLRSISGFCKLVISSIEYDLNEDLIDSMTNLVSVIEQHDYEEPLDERKSLRVGTQMMYEFDISMIKKCEEDDPDYKNANMINLYIAIWKSLKIISVQIEELNLKAQSKFELKKS